MIGAPIIKATGAAMLFNGLAPDGSVRGRTRLAPPAVNPPQRALGGTNGPFPGPKFRHRTKRERASQSMAVQCGAAGPAANRRCPVKRLSGQTDPIKGTRVSSKEKPWPHYPNPQIPALSLKGAVRLAKQSRPFDEHTRGPTLFTPPAVNPPQRALSGTNGPFPGPKFRHRTKRERASQSMAVQCGAAGPAANRRCPVKRLSGQTDPIKGTRVSSKEKPWPHYPNPQIPALSLKGAVRLAKQIRTVRWTHEGRPCSPVSDSDEERYGMRPIFKLTPPLTSTCVDVVLLVYGAFARHFPDTGEKASASHDEYGKARPF